MLIWAIDNVYLSSDWLLVLWFWCCDSQIKLLSFFEPSFREKHCTLKGELFVSSWELTL